MEDRSEFNTPLSHSDSSEGNKPTAIKIEDEDEVSLSLSTSRPPKRMRLVPIVLVSTWADLQQRRKDEREDFKKLRNMKNPKVKTKKNMELLIDTVRDRLKPIGLDLYNIDLDKSIQEATVTRRFMSSTYGGSMQATFPEISKENLEKHGFRDWMYLNGDYQPEAPQIPGAPGLFYCTEAGDDWPEIQRAFTRIKAGVWQFMGMYEVKSSASLTKQEWMAQPDKVKTTWGREITKQDWGGSVCARVHGRKIFGREPTAAECEQILVTIKRGSEIATPEEIIEAYNQGEEELGVWTMKCINYDIPFQKSLAEDFPKWVPPAPKKTKAGEKMAKRSAKSKAVKPAPRDHKRKRAESSDTDMTETESKFADSPRMLKKQEMKTPELSEKQEPEETRVYKPKGTRSRPICL